MVIAPPSSAWTAKSIPAYYGTGALWRMLPRLLELRVKGAEILGADGYVRTCPVTVLGAARPDVVRNIWSRADKALSQASSAIDAAAKYPTRLTIWTARQVRDLVFESWAELRHAATDAFREGATAAGDVLVILATRVGQAGHLMATNLQDAFRAFWGVPPIAVPIAAVLFAVALAMGGLAVLAHPAAQAFVLDLVTASGTAAGKLAPGVLVAGIAL